MGPVREFGWRVADSGLPFLRFPRVGFGGVVTSGYGLFCKSARLGMVSSVEVVTPGGG